jgi:hypothetical protein
MTADRQCVLTPAELAAARAAGVAGGAVVSERAVRRAMRLLEAAEPGTALVAETADEDRCPCGGPLDNGERYDGKCGSCADVAEEAGKWE